MSKLPKVILVGRTNVGKSTLFNRLAHEMRSITLDQEGVTRDFIADIVCWKDICFELIDTGGISTKKSEDFLAEQVRQLAISLLKQADVILFLTDASVGLLPEEREIAKLIREYPAKVCVVANKSDAREALEREHEFSQLGFDCRLTISALHGRGIAELLDEIIRDLPKKERPIEQPQQGCRVVLLGKPNVGKSSLLNLLTKQDRALVTNIPGTTREPITQQVKFFQETITLTDTAGIRRKRSVDEDLEKIMVKTSFKALDRADVVLLLIDGSQGLVSNQELKLLDYAFTSGKSVALLINKLDIITQEDKDRLVFEMERYAHIFKKIPHLYISCLSEKHIGKILPLVQTLWERYNQKFADDELTKIIKAALKKTPLYHSGQRLIVYSVCQVATAPIRLLLKVNEPQWFGPSQQAFLDNTLRKKLNLIGVPLLFKYI